jgi:hypothetical protein
MRWLVAAAALAAGALAGAADAASPERFDLHCVGRTHRAGTSASSDGEFDNRLSIDLARRMYQVAATRHVARMAAVSPERITLYRGAGNEPGEGFVSSIEIGADRYEYRSARTLRGEVLESTTAACRVRPFTPIPD